MLYPWIKALHVIAVIPWMAGLLYLPRLFVYHCKAQLGSSASETFKVMEEKLVRIIMTPAMIVAWICGLGMIGMNPELLMLEFPLLLTLPPVAFDEELPPAPP